MPKWNSIKKNLQYYNKRLCYEISVQLIIKLIKSKQIRNRQEQHF